MHLYFYIFLSFYYCVIIEWLVGSLGFGLNICAPFHCHELDMLTGILQYRCKLRDKSGLAELKTNKIFKILNKRKKRTITGIAARFISPFL